METTPTPVRVALNLKQNNTVDGSFASRRHFAVTIALSASTILLATASVYAQTAAGVKLPPPPTTTAQHGLLVQVQEAFTKIAATVEPSVVNIKAERINPADADDSPDASPDAPSKPKGDKSTPPRFAPRGPRRSMATGSGVIIRSDGYILTNDHVVEGANNGIVTVTLYDGREFKGKVYPDFRSDLAVVKIDPGNQPLPAASFAESSTVIPGQWAIAIGSPFGLTNTMTVGVISAIGRHQTIPGESRNDSRYYPELIQTDAAINPGNSGGPLFNIDGKIVGINVAIESPVEGSAGVGFAIPSRVAQQIMNLLITKGSVARGYLGVAPDDLTPSLADEFAVKSGAFVRDVSVSSPAGKAGLQAGDVVTAYDGQEITDEVGLRQAISITPPGKKVRIDYIRAAVPSHIDVVIAAPPNDHPAAPPTPLVPMAPQPKIGLTVRDVTAQDRQLNGFGPDTTGAYISAVEPGSPAESASFSTGVLLSGTVVQKVGRTVIRNAADFKKAVDALGSQSQTTLIVLLSSAGAVHQSAITVRL